MAPVKVAVNGIGRIGHLAVRLVFERPDKFELVHLNDIGSCDSIAYLIKRDSVHGPWKHGSKADGGDAVVFTDADSGRTLRVPYSMAKTPAALADAYKKAGVELLLECTGEFLKHATLEPYFSQCGVKKIVVSAPVKDTPEVLNVVVGVNHQLYNPAVDHIVTAASCTTNCLAPVVQVIHDKIGIVHGCITTAHNLTNTQTLLDCPINKKNDLRRGRSGFMNMAPTSTGSATAIALIFPELKGKLNGLAIRVPLTNSSITDCVFEVKRATTVEEVNALLRAAAEAGPLKDILGFETEQLVSTDYVNDPRSGIVDADCTQVIDSTLVKLFVWYDNEFGYTMRMVELAQQVAAAM